MKIQRVLNRGSYVKFVVILPPSLVSEAGWVGGEELSEFLVSGPNNKKAVLLEEALVQPKRKVRK